MFIVQQCIDTAGQKSFTVYGPGLYFCLQPKGQKGRGRIVGESELGTDKGVVVESSSRKWPMPCRVRVEDRNNTVCIDAIERNQDNQ
ncbi:MAG: hypothetical protein CMI52_00205 [Parcubacteria group bacterium]|nr:hypothetical protein [Parcubacteria group bacterium]